MQINDLPPYIVQLIDATQKDQIAWDRANPTTYSYGSGNALLSIQQVPQRRVAAVFSGAPPQPTPPVYAFEVIDTSARSTLISVNTRTAEQLTPLLQQLYRAADDSLSRRGLDLLKTVLPPPQPH
jgi:hypothetical protein